MDSQTSKQRPDSSRVYPLVPIETMTNPTGVFLKRPSADCAPAGAASHRLLPRDDSPESCYWRKAVNLPRTPAAGVPGSRKYAKTGGATRPAQERRCRLAVGCSQLSALGSWLSGRNPCPNTPRPRTTGSFFVRVVCIATCQNLVFSRRFQESPSVKY